VCLYKLREIDGSESAKWNELIRSLPGGTIFHTPKWLKLIEANQRLRIKKVGVCLDDKLIGVFPLCVKNFLFIKVAGSPFVVEDTPYMGPVIDPRHIPNFLEALDNYLRINRIDFLRIISNQAYNVKNRSDFYHFIEKCTHIVELTKTEDALWKNLEGRCRTAIRKARKSGVDVNIVTDRCFIDKYYSIIEDVYHAQNKPCPNHKKFYYDMWNSFGRDNALFLSAEWNGKIIAGIIILLDGKRAYYLNGASKHAHRSLSASNLLLWEAINIAKERGVERFDFVGSNIERLARFKKSFGGEVTKYTLIEKASSKWVGLIRQRYPAYKTIMGNLINHFNLNSLHS